MLGNRICTVYQSPVRKAALFHGASLAELARLYEPDPDDDRPIVYHCQQEKEASGDEDRAAALEQAVVDRRGVPGWDKVARLATALLATKGLCVTNSQVAEIVRLWEALDPVDRRPTSFSPTGLPKEPRGRFARKYRSGHIGVEATAR